MLFRKPAPLGAVDAIIVGLGNPGKKYEGTRHNAGFAVVEALAAEYGVKVDRVKFKSLCGQTVIGGKKVLLLMPQTFMNNSGEAVREAAAFYKLPPEKVLVVCDDISLPVGTIRLRRKGSDGGQRGLRSIITLCGSENFPRIKVGVGQKPHPDYDLAAWVLSKFTKDESVSLLAAVKNAVGAAAMIVDDRMDEAMNRFSR
ncbi:MAG: aminoacyl-tRNA hydrolase [Clostridia bacterium]|nr:aminoacyl-tRNA hydrolase [Clostridia bacterium]